MVRFIDLRKQGTGYRFAFFDTVRDRFMQFGEEQAWDDVSAFSESLMVYCQMTGADFDVTFDRFYRLMPMWARKRKLSLLGDI